MNRNRKSSPKSKAYDDVGQRLLLEKIEDRWTLAISPLKFVIGKRADGMRILAVKIDGMPFVPIEELAALLAAEKADHTGRAPRLCNDACDEIRQIEFIRDKLLFVQINGSDPVQVDLVPFVTLYVTCSRYKSHGKQRWPEAHELCAAAKQVMGKLRAESGLLPCGTWKQNEKALWRDWKFRTRATLNRAVNDGMLPPISVFDLLPDAKRSRKRGLHPKVSDSCKIEGVETLNWGKKKEAAA